MAQPPPKAAIAGDPEWLAHRYDPTADAVHFIRATRNDHRAATFLTDEFLAGHRMPVAIGRASALAGAPSPAPVHFILHSAFCLSTLLARALDIEGVSMGVKEPVILNDISGWRQRGGEPAQVARALDGALALLARPFAPGEAVVVKPSNLLNPLASAMLAMRPKAHALLLYAPLETFLGSVARKGMWGRLWVRDLMVKLRKQGAVELGFSDDDYLHHTDLQVAAVGWLAQHAIFARLVERYGDRVRTLDSERVTADPAAVMTSLASFFRLDLSADRIRAITLGPTFKRHSKSGVAFDAVDRAGEQRDGFAAHEDEIGRVTVWAKAVADTSRLSLTLPAPLELRQKKGGPKGPP